MGSTRVGPNARPIATVACAVALALASACAGVRTVETKDAAFIYGYIDIPEKVGAANCVGIIQDERVGIVVRHECMKTSPEGLFYIEDLPPMRYNIHGFYVDRTFHSLGHMAKPFPVAAGSMHFVGSFSYQVLEEPGIGRPGRFALGPSRRVSHADVLRKLLQQPDLAPRWKKRVAARLAALGKAS